MQRPELIEALRQDLKAMPNPPMGWLVRMINGATYWVVSDPIHWPESIIHRVMCVTRSAKP